MSKIIFLIRYFSKTTTLHCGNQVLCIRGRIFRQVADGGKGLQMWRVVMKILNKLLQRADRGW
jgi:hypothetical protein